jgi:hypothetical protein
MFHKRHRLSKTGLQLGGRGCRSAKVCVRELRGLNWYQGLDGLSDQVGLVHHRRRFRGAVTKSQVPHSAAGGVLRVLRVFAGSMKSARFKPNGRKVLEGRRGEFWGAAVTDTPSIVFKWQIMSRSKALIYMDCCRLKPLVYIQDQCRYAMVYFDS